MKSRIIAFCLTVGIVTLIGGATLAVNPKNSNKPVSESKKLGANTDVVKSANTYIQYYATYRDSLANGQTKSLDIVSAKKSAAKIISLSPSGLKTQRENIKMANQYMDFVSRHQDDYSAIHTRSDFKITSVTINGNIAEVIGVEEIYDDLTVKSNSDNTEISSEKAKYMKEAQAEGDVIQSGETVHSSSELKHKLKLVFTTATGWLVDNDNFENPYDPPKSARISPQTKNDQPVVFLETLEDLEDSAVNRQLTFCSSLLFKRGWSYNRAGAVSYADTYCWDGPSKDYNHKYTFYPDNDCANFISQCFYEGGGVPKAQGTWQPGTNKWIRAGEFFDYMVSRGAVMSSKNLGYWNANDYQKKYLYKGDLIGFYSLFSHISIVTKLDAKGNCYYSAHTASRYQVLWDRYAGNTTYHMAHMYDSRQ